MSEQYFEGQVRRDVSYQYLLYLPSDYENSDANWPLVVFLHGSGESGADLELVRLHGPPQLYRRRSRLSFHHGGTTGA